MRPTLSHTAGSPPTALDGLPWAVRRARLRDAPSVGVVLVRAYHRKDGRHLDSLCYFLRPRPVRAAIMWMIGVLMTLFAETWIAWHCRPCAFLTICPTGSRIRRGLRIMLVLLVLGSLLGMVGAFADEVLPPPVGELVIDSPLLVLIVVCVVYLIIELATNKLLPIERRAVRTLPAPVWHVHGLASVAPGAGLALVEALATAADAHQATVVASTAGEARIRLSRRGGFREVARAPRPWGPSALLVRSPRSSSGATGHGDADAPSRAVDHAVDVDVDQPASDLE